MRTFPIVGAGIGLAGGAIYAAAYWLGLPSFAAALCALAGIALGTGALHEDGLADTVDGFGAGRDAEEKLRIMADSHTGAYGALAIVFSVGLRASAISALADPGTIVSALVVAGAVSRAALPVMTERLAPARTEGLAAWAGRPGRQIMFVSAAIGIAITMIVLGLGTGVLVVVAAVAATAAVAGLAQRQIGGYTGDVLGTAQQVVEVVVLLTIAATLEV